MEKTLIVYYSKSGKSEMLAKTLREKTGYDIDKLEYADKDHISFPAAVIESLRKTTVEIKGYAHNPAEYDRIIFVSPVWGSALSTPIRSYMSVHRKKIKTYSLIAVCGKIGLEGTVKDATTVMEKEPSVSEQYISAQVGKGTYNLEKFMASED